MDERQPSPRRIPLVPKAGQNANIPVRTSSGAIGYRAGVADHVHVRTRLARVIDNNTAALVSRAGFVLFDI